MITFTEGNIFEADVETIVIPVNCVGVMGKGLALQAKKLYPSFYNCYKGHCNNGSLVTGGLFIFGLLPEEKFKSIIAFPTKDHWRESSEYSYIQEGLERLSDEIENLEIKSIAIPALGCGLGSLDWDTVRELIEYHMRRLKCKILLFSPQEK